MEWTVPVLEISSHVDWRLVIIGFGTFLFIAASRVLGYKRRSAKQQRMLEAPRIRFPRQDLPPVFPNGWIPVLESEALEIEAVKRLDVLGLELVAFRTKDGVAHVADAYCPHLGAHLGVLGRVVGNCIECSFHGWRFDGNGVCVRVSDDAKVPEFVRLKKWETDEAMGMIFVWYHAEGEAPSWSLEDVSEISSGDWKLFDRHEETVTGHIRDILENASDMAHFRYLHGPNFFVTAGEFSQNGGTTCWGRFLTHTWRAKWYTKEHKSFLDIDMDMEVFGKPTKFLHSRTLLSFQGPALFVSRSEWKYGEAIVVTSIIPEGPLQLRFVHRLYCSWSTLLIFRLFASRAFRIAFQRDALAWNNKTIWKNPPLQKGDRTIADFRRWYQQFYSQNSPTWQIVRDRSLQW